MAWLQIATHLANHPRLHHQLLRSGYGPVYTWVRYCCLLRPDLQAPLLHTSSMMLAAVSSSHQSQQQSSVRLRRAIGMPFTMALLSFTWSHCLISWKLKELSRMPLPTSCMPNAAWRGAPRVAGVQLKQISMLASKSWCCPKPLRCWW